MQYCIQDTVALTTRRVRTERTAYNAKARWRRKSSAPYRELHFNFQSVIIQFNNQLPRLDTNKITAVTKCSLQLPKYWTYYSIPGKMVEFFLGPPPSYPLRRGSYL
jgi:hypothetical protein